MDNKDCVFCKIARGEIDSKKIYEDGDAVAFLDINPSTPGHALVVPKIHYESIFSIDEITLRRTVGVVKKVADKMRRELNVEGVSIVQNNGRLAGQIVDHIHFHLIPRYPDDNFKIHYPKRDVPEDELDKMQAKLGMMK